MLGSSRATHHLSMSVGFALLSLLFAGLLDVVFKWYARIDRSRGMYVLGIGVVWTALQCLIILASGTTISIDGQMLAFGLTAGLLLSVANLCLIESLTHVDVSLASTIYRLNTIGVVALAVILLGEPLTPVKATGVVIGLAAVMVLYERGRGAPHQRRVALYFWLAVLASILRACFGIVTKAAALRGVDLQLLLLLNGPVWILVGGIYAIFREKGLRVTAAKVKYSLVSGSLACGVVNFLMLALALGEASVVVPIANMSFLVALLISTGQRMERFTSRKLVVVALTVTAIVVLANA
ncbi:MAG: EamA family transporter [Betaproteobacteria bacterium]|nr:EamA family transporter [Betaproteobacteria bacterium]